MSFNVGVIGATGKVGEVLREILSQRKFPTDSIRFFASARSAGKQIPWKTEEGEQDIEVEDASKADFGGLDFALFSAGASISKQLCPKAAEAGAVVIDNSSAFRSDENIPLVVAEVNPHQLRNTAQLKNTAPNNASGSNTSGSNTSDSNAGNAGGYIIANPNCTTMVGMVALKPLHQVASLKRLTVSTYQAVSGMGNAGVAELNNQITSQFNQTANQAMEHELFDAQIALNVIPKCGDYTIDDPDETIEERKFVNETRKILEIPNLPVSATCVRVGVDTGHSLSINAEFENPISPQAAKEILASAPGITLDDLPNPVKSAGMDEVMVGRIRKDPTVKNGLCLFVVGDNLRKGAALNAIQIAEIIAGH